MKRVGLIPIIILILLSATLQSCSPVGRSTSEIASDAIDVLNTGSYKVTFTSVAQSDGGECAFTSAQASLTGYFDPRGATYSYSSPAQLSGTVFTELDGTLYVESDGVGVKAETDGEGLKEFRDRLAVFFDGSAESLGKLENAVVIENEKGIMTVRASLDKNDTDGMREALEGGERKLTLTEQYLEIVIGSSGALSRVTAFAAFEYSAQTAEADTDAKDGGEGTGRVSLTYSYVFESTAVTVSAPEGAEKFSSVSITDILTQE